MPPAASAWSRRALAWYSGPCLRGSAYSFGLIVQYVPLAAPYQPAPLQPGSNGSSSPGSYNVEYGVALFGDRRRPDGRRARPGPEAVEPAPVPPLSPVSPAPFEPGSV